LFNIFNDGTKAEESSIFKEDEEPQPEDDNLNS
jgi:hypothetical protein